VVAAKKLCRQPLETTPFRGEGDHAGGDRRTTASEATFGPIEIEWREESNGGRAGSWKQWSESVSIKN